MRRISLRQPPPLASNMPSLLRAFQLDCESYISSASFRKPTALLASPSFGKWNHGHMTMRHRTGHTAGMPQDGDGPFAPAERKNIRRLLQQGYRLFDVFRLEDHISRRPRMVFDAMVEEDKELASRCGSGNVGNGRMKRRST